MCKVTSLQVVMLVNDDAAKSAAQLINQHSVADAAVLAASAMTLLDSDGQGDLLFHLREVAEEHAILSTGAQLALAQLHSNDNSGLLSAVGQRINVRI